MMDGFFGYNRIKVLPEDQEKATFTTPWGTFMYAKMPFGLMNAGATFQRAMDIAFAREIGKFVVIYMDDITVYSSSDREHIHHLEKVFIKCRKFGISLNPNFALEEWKLLGHIISKDRIKIDPNRVSAILKVGEPKSKKEIQSFLGQVNFLRRFIPSFAKILMNITNMLKKGHEIKWTTKAKKSFKEIKQAISEAPMLVISNFTKDFLIFLYAL